MPRTIGRKVEKKLVLLCLLDWTNLQTHPAPYANHPIDLWILKPFIIFFHSYRLLGAYRIARCASTTLFFAGEENRNWFTIFIVHIHHTSFFSFLKCFGIILSHSSSVKNWYSSFLILFFALAYALALVSKATLYITASLCAPCLTTRHIFQYFFQTELIICINFHSTS